ncbi:hypothetical protein KM043_006309 [Ampulex compressa]|nr:hypothetical protein KM043_006309 [Ampulex compressa]
MVFRQSAALENTVRLLCANDRAPFESQTLFRSTLCTLRHATPQLTLSGRSWTKQRKSAPKAKRTRPSKSVRNLFQLAERSRGGESSPWAMKRPIRSLFLEINRINVFATTDNYAPSPSNDTRERRVTLARNGNGFGYRQLNAASRKRIGINNTLLHSVRLASVESTHRNVLPGHGYSDFPFPPPRFLQDSRRVPLAAEGGPKGTSEERERREARRGIDDRAEKGPEHRASKGGEQRRRGTSRGRKTERRKERERERRREREGIIPRLNIGANRRSDVASEETRDRRDVERCERRVRVGVGRESRKDPSLDLDAGALPFPRKLQPIDYESPTPGGGVKETPVGADARQTVTERRLFLRFRKRRGSSSLRNRGLDRDLRQTGTKRAREISRGSEIPFHAKV